VTPNRGDALVDRLDRADRRLTRWLGNYGIPILRISLGIIFFWFGFLKFFPSLSPAEGLVGRTIEAMSFGIVPPSISLPVLAVWESVIGLGLIFGTGLRLILLLLMVQMIGTLFPIVLFPNEVFTRIPWAPTLEGQYIIKNLVLISAALVIGATVRGGTEVETEPRNRPPQQPFRRRRPRQ
jgi:uncharacterized membrane protein YphA (DoxX/SURF4 family)